MKKIISILSLVCCFIPMTAQENSDTADIFYKHLELNEVIVTGLTGETKMKYSPTPVSIVSGKELRQISSTNIIDAIARQPGIAQITTGSGISKPVIRGLGYNRIITISDGVRQEGQQWGDEHGIEVDAQGVSPASMSTICASECRTIFLFKRIISYSNMSRSSEKRWSLVTIMTESSSSMVSLPFGMMT